MLKKSTLLFIGTFFLLFIGVSDYGYGCHKGGNDSKGCGDPPQGGEEGSYSVTITGAIDGHSSDGIDWTERKSGEGIGHSSYNIGDVGKLDLGFFFMHFDEPFFKDRGEYYFGSASGLLFNQAGIRKHKGGSVLGRFWFKGCTDKGTVGGDPFRGDCIREVLYSLDLLGLFEIPDNWRPASGTTTTLTITSWELIVEAEGDVVKSRSCIGGSEEEDGFQVEILVTRTN